jgi:hypothetical protein
MTGAPIAASTIRRQRGDAGWALLPVLVVSVCLYFFWRHEQQAPDMRFVIRFS